MQIAEQVCLVVVFIVTICCYGLHVYRVFLDDDRFSGKTVVASTSLAITSTYFHFKISELSSKHGTGVRQNEEKIFCQLTGNIYFTNKWLLLVDWQ